MLDYKEKAFLVVDDITEMRSSMRTTIATFGGFKIDMSSSAFDALGKLERTPYDIVLCDYVLGDAMDGQQLLEEIKRRKLLKSSSIFMMVTAERGYERVVSAVELAPDDYLIKPFTGETLRARLDRLVKKKAVFAPVYNLMDDQEYRKAIQICDELIKLKNQYVIDLMRLKAELHMTLGEFPEAGMIYEQILKVREIPWAQLGLAKCRYHEQNYEEAVDMLESLVETNPNYLAAQDWLAKTYSLTDKSKEAQNILMNATAKSPRIVPRQKTLGETAYKNQDLDTAQNSFRAVLDYGKYSSLTAPEDFANLSRVHLDKGNHQEALDLMKDARKTFKKSPEAMLHAAVMDSLIHSQSGDQEAAEAAYREAMQLYGENPDIPPSAAIDLARASFTRGDEEAGQNIVQTLVKNNHENTAILKQTENMFDQIGMLEKGRTLISESAKEIISLNNRAVKMAQAGDLKGSVELLIQAAEGFDANNVIKLNAAHAIIAFMHREGWNDNLGANAKRYLGIVKQREPDNQKLASLNTLYRETAKKYGIRV